MPVMFQPDLHVQLATNGDTNPIKGASQGSHGSYQPVARIQFEPIDKPRPFQLVATKVGTPARHPVQMPEIPQLISRYIGFPGFSSHSTNFPKKFRKIRRFKGATHELARSGDNRQRMDQLLRTWEFFDRWIKN